MIRKTGEGFQVKSEGGKNLSKPNLTKEQAEKRLAQVEMFKHMDKSRHETERPRYRVQ
jgi:hypothetical protein